MVKTKKQPLVSVIIPCYNSLAYLPETLDSVFQQTYPHLEIIVIEDGSSEPAKTYIETLYSHQLKYYFLEHVGVAAAKNFGINKANGEFIAFLDADDLWLPNKIELQVNIIVQTGLSWSATRSLDFHSDSGTTLSETSIKATGEYFFENLLFHNYICNSSVLVNKPVLNHVGLFDEHIKFGEDWDLWLRIAHIYPMAYIPDILVKRRIHPSSITSSSTVEERLSQRLAIINKLEINQMINGHRKEQVFRHHYQRAFDESLAINDTLKAEEYLFKSIRYGRSLKTCLYAITQKFLGDAGFKLIQILKKMRGLLY